VKDKFKAEVCLVVTSLMIVKFFLIPHIGALARRYSVTLIVDVDDRVFLESMALPVRVISVPIRRKVSPWWDLVALFRLVFLFRRHRFQMVHSISPKGGLLGIVAAWMSGVPVRVHTFQGEVWATRRGLWRAILRFLDRLVARLATKLTVVSHSEREFLIAEGIIPADKSVVLAQGSICGVDPARFHPDAEMRNTVRRDLGISDDALVVLFLGRLNRDKGVLDLTKAFVKLAAETPEPVLLVVGPDEEGIFEEALHDCATCARRVRRVGFTQNPEWYLAGADILCLPSYREGFGLVIVEAAAVGIPSVCSNIYGITDAVDNGKTGLLFPPGDIPALEQALSVLVNNDELRHAMAAAAKERALSMFSQDRVVEAMLEFYDQLLQRTLAK
jgi:glycosyltransferase involved in cell wall biosynthesis